MALTLDSIVENALLASLSKSDLGLLMPKLEWVELILGEVVNEANKVVEYAYFPVSGICSIIAQNEEGVQIETGLIGREGFVGTSLVLFVDSAPSQVIVQAGGRAVRISRVSLQKAIEKSPSLLKTLLRFAHIFNVQVSQTAVANGYYTISQRLARWLLMCQDRVDSHEFPMTHLFLSVMLAVRRAGITEALNFLEGKKAIRAMRGRVVVLNRSILEEMAGAAYGIPEREYRRVIAGKSTNTFAVNSK
jgi:CRP-like cAMP-binding protein